MLFYYLGLLETGEEQSDFIVLYETYKNLMFHIAYEILQNESDAEDAVHKAFIKVIENFDCVGAPKSARTKNWIATIVKNIALNMRKRDKLYRSRVRVLDEFEDLPDTGRVSEITDEYGLKDLIAALPEKYRDILHFVLTYGQDYKAISKLLDISEAAARKRFERAKKMLKDLLREKGGFADEL